MRSVTATGIEWPVVRAVAVSRRRFRADVPVRRRVGIDANDCCNEHAEVLPRRACRHRAFLVTRQSGTLVDPGIPHLEVVDAALGSIVRRVPVGMSSSPTIGTGTDPTSQYRGAPTGACGGSPFG